MTKENRVCAFCGECAVPHEDPGILCAKCRGSKRLDTHKPGRCAICESLLDHRVDPVRALSVACTNCLNNPHITEVEIDKVVAAMVERFGLFGVWVNAALSVGAGAQSQGRD